MKKLLFLIVVSLMLVGVASARTVWRPDLNTPPIFAPAAGDWMDEGNWDAGVPVMEPEIDNTAGKAVFFHPEATAECWVTTPDAVCWTLNAGDNEPMVAPLVIKDGGTLTTGPVWSGIGYNTVGEVIVEKGGQIDFGSHLWIGMLAGADATLTINGGTVNVGVAFDVGRVVGAEALVSVNAGLLSVTHVTTPAASGWYKHDGGVIDISFGTFKVDRNLLAWNGIDLIDTQIASGQLTAFGGGGTIEAEFVDGWTYVTATDDPLVRTPTYGGLASTAAGPVVDLSWINLDSIPSGGDVYVDVWFGTDTSVDPVDPNLFVDFVKLVDAGVNTITAPATTYGNGEYLWRVDSYLNGDPAIPGLYEDLPDDGDPNTSEDALYEVVEGILMEFTSIDDFPPSIVIDTVPTITWAGMPVTIDATITDEGTSEVTVIWSVDEAIDPNVSFVPASVTYPPGTTYPLVTTTIMTGDSHIGNFDLTVTVSDGNELLIEGTDTLHIDCAANACQATMVLGLGEPEDIDEDCQVSLPDIAILALDWASDYTIIEPTVIP